jgi:uncharacterized protein (DUF427 family)
MAESVWDYPRPPRLEPTDRLVRVELGGRVVAETRKALRVLETSHPPNYYIPLDDIDASLLEPSGGATSFCEWKGNATYFDVVVGHRRAERAAWTYPDPTPSFQQLRGYVAFYVAPMDRCTVDDEVATPEERPYYGGWVTSDVLVERGTVRRTGGS